jgi:hypothetical protein
LGWRKGEDKIRELLELIFLSLYLQYDSLLFRQKKTWQFIDYYMLRMGMGRCCYALRISSNNVKKQHQAVGKKTTVAIFEVLAVILRPPHFLEKRNRKYISVCPKFKRETDQSSETRFQRNLEENVVT